MQSRWQRPQSALEPPRQNRLRTCLVACQVREMLIEILAPLCCLPPEPLDGLASTAMSGKSIVLLLTKRYDSQFTVTSGSRPPWLTRSLRDVIKSIGAALD